MEIDLTEKEIFIIRNYIDDMIALYNESDMIIDKEPLHLSKENIPVYRDELIALEKKLSFS